MTYQPLIGYWKYSRKPKFFLFNYIQPSVLINLLALFVFLIPAESGGPLLFLVQQQIVLTMVSSGEKITLGISTMLNMTIFLMTVRVRHQTSYQDKFHLYFRIIYIFLPLGVGGKADPRFKVIVTPGDVWFAADRQNSNRQHLLLHHYGRARFLLWTTTKHS